jgi:hypothetical protein
LPEKWGEITVCQRAKQQFRFWINFPGSDCRNVKKEDAIINFVVDIGILLEVDTNIVLACELQFQDLFSRHFEMYVAFEMKLHVFAP